MLVLLLASIPTLLALAPPRLGQLEKYRADGTLQKRIADAYAIGNHRVAPRLVARLREKLDALARQIGSGTYDLPQVPMAPPPAWQGMPTRGVVRVPVLLVAFADMPPVTSIEEITGHLFGDGPDGFPYESLRNYYLRSSYNQLDIQGDVLGWYTTAYPRSQVVSGENLIKEVINYYASAGHDFSQYDSDGNGVIDYLIVFWTGPYDYTSNIWWGGWETSFSDTAFTVDGKQISDYTWLCEIEYLQNPKFEPFYVIHETGHALGLPDYYDYNDWVGPSGGLGGLDMMDMFQGDHNCFSKWLLDWLTPTVYHAGRHEVTLAPTASVPQAAVLIPDNLDGPPFCEFFMIQYRNRDGNDAKLPADGLLIWHVDARLDSTGLNFRYDNSYTEHKLLRLMEADGLEEIEKGKPADAGDYYQAGSQLGPATTPNSNFYGGIPTNLTVDSISDQGATMSLTATFDQQVPTLQNVRLCISSDACVITWQTDEWTNALVDWGLDAGLGTLAAGEGINPHHSVRLTGLQPSTTYVFKVYSQDLTGNGTESGYFHFSTAATSPPPMGVFTDDMENGPGEWTRIPSGPDPWRIVRTNYADSGTNAWFSSDSPSWKDDRLLTRPIDLTNAVYADLIFSHTFQTEPDHDGGVVEVSTDGANTFHDLGPDIQTGGYNGLISPYYAYSAISGQPAWTGGTLGLMEPVAARLDRYIGYPVIIQFRMVCDMFWHDFPGGWYVDDVNIWASPCTATAPEPGVPAGSGDLNGDTFVDAADQLLLAHFLAENLNVIPAGMYQADLNADAKVNVVDFTLLSGILVRNRLNHE